MSVSISLSFSLPLSTSFFPPQSLSPLSILVFHLYLPHHSLSSSFFFTLLNYAPCVSVPKFSRGYAVWLCI